MSKVNGSAKDGYWSGIVSGRPGGSSARISVRALDAAGNVAQSEERLIVWQSVSLEAFGSASVVGNEGRIEVRVKNNGSRAIDSVTLTDIIPAGVSLLSSNPSADSTAAGIASWRLGSLPVGGLAVINVVYELSTGSGILNSTFEAVGKANGCTDVTTKVVVPIRFYRQSVIPILECIRTSTDGSRIAYFGYRSDNSFPVRIALGPANQLSTGDGAQPVTFQPGRQSFVFGIPMSGHELVWRLDGSSAKADEGSLGCGGCGIDGKNHTCQTFTDVFTAMGSAGGYSWFIDGSPAIGERSQDGRSITIKWIVYPIGEHDMSVSMMDREGREISRCNMTVHVIEEPIAKIEFVEEP
jgi:uncharacterized repeat protein (TIGR01451 family)